MKEFHQVGNHSLLPATDMATIRDSLGTLYWATSDMLHELNHLKSPGTSSHNGPLPLKTTQYGPFSRGEGHFGGFSFSSLAKLDGAWWFEGLFFGKRTCSFDDIDQWHTRNLRPREMTCHLQQLSIPGGLLEWNELPKAASPNETMWMVMLKPPNMGPAEGII